MRKIICGFLSFFFIINVFFPVTLDRDLINSAKKVSYIEDTSPVPKSEYNTREEIKNMGRRLARTVLRLEKQKSLSPIYAYGEPDKKYRVSRVYESELLPGSDVLYLAPNAKVTTAKALFFIVSGYLEEAFSLSEKTSDSLAEKICYWNTNHYDEKNYFAGRFSPDVINAFAGETAVIGLADSYKNWAGHTRIIIPFTLTHKTVKETNPAKNSEKNAAFEHRFQNEKKVTIAKTNGQNKYLKAKKSIPLNYKILFAALCLAGLLLLILLIKVMRDLTKR